MKSKCCLAPVRVEGDKDDIDGKGLGGTMYHVCENCGQPCDIAPAMCYGSHDKASEYCRKVCKYADDCIKN